MTKPAVAFLHASQASQGARARQEDYSSLWQPNALPEGADVYPLLAVLADGMGGHVSGQIASQLACDSFIDAFAADSGDVGPRMARALDAANAALSAKIAAEPDHDGMGCTLIATYLDDDGLRWASVGDSALLLFRKGVLHRLNADHSHGAVLDKQAAEGIITKQAAQNDSRRRALRSALTGDRIPLQEIHAQALELDVGDLLIIASDGLLTLNGNEIASITQEFGPTAPESLADTLVASVNGKNLARQDNTTLIVVGVVESDGSPPVISVPVRSKSVTSAHDGVMTSSTARVLGLKLPHFVLVVLLVFLIGFFAF